MSPNIPTAPERLALLLPWLNGAFDRDVYAPGDRPEDVLTWTDVPAVRRALDAFVASFDGSAGAGYLVAAPDDDAAALDDDAVGELEVLLQMLLEEGFGEPARIASNALPPEIAAQVAPMRPGDCALPLDELRIVVRGAGRQKPKWIVNKKTGQRVLDGGREARMKYYAAGAYLLDVYGPTRALVPFLVAHLLMQPGMVAVKRCARRDQPPWVDCPHLFIVAPGTRGQPRRFCSRSCGLRYTEQEEQQRSQRRKNHR